MIEYNILNKQSEGECTSPDPAKIIYSYKSSRFLNFTRAQDGYFLFFIFRIATIKDAVVKIIINSSYVLISIILSVMLGSDGARPPTTWVNILYYSFFRLYLVLHISSCFFTNVLFHYKKPLKSFLQYFLEIILREVSPFVIELVV